MNALLERLLDLLRESEGPLGYLALGLASLIEYVFPPFPGDTVALFGVFLAITAGYRIWLVYLVLNLGSLVGGMAAYAFGRRLDPEHPELPRLLRGARAQAALREVCARFERRGAVYLALNRFLPALRAFFFIGAGMARLPASKVAFYGGVSGLVWNALLLGLGWLAGDHWERLSGWLTRYSQIVIFCVAVALVVWIGLALRKRFKSRDTDGDTDGQGH